jgi:hypothetical protein
LAITSAAAAAAEEGSYQFTQASKTSAQHEAETPRVPEAAEVKHHGQYQQ